MNARDIASEIIEEARAQNVADIRHAKLTAELAERDDDMRYEVQNDCTALGNPAKRPRVTISSCPCAYNRVKGELEPCERHREMADELDDDLGRRIAREVAETEEDVG